MTNIVSLDTGALSLDERQVAIGAIRNEIYGRFFEIFVTIAAVLAALSAVLGIGVYSILRGSINRLIEKEIDERVRVAQARTLSIAFNEFAFSWFRQYEPILQKILSHEHSTTSEEKQRCLESVETTRDLAGHGLEVYEDLSIEDMDRFLSTTRGKRAIVNILNQILYADTAKMLVSGFPFSLERIEEMNKQADQLWELGTSKELSEEDYSWWEAVETVGFFRLHVGRLSCDKKLESKGRIIIMNLAGEQPPKMYLKRLPQEISQGIRREYSANGFDLPF